MLAALAAGVMIYWWIAAAEFDKALEAENGREIAPGVHLVFAKKSIEGFPFRLDAVWDNAEIDISARYGPLTWRSEHLAMHMLTYDSSRQIFEAAGRQSLSWTDAEGRHHHFEFIPGSLEASAIEWHDVLARFDLDIVGIGSPELSGGRIQFHVRHEPVHDALDFVLSGDALRLAPDLRTDFRGEIERLDVEGRLVPASEFTPMLAGRSDWRTATEHWRRRAGAVIVQNIDLKWKHGVANGRGRLSLDDAHRIRGTINLDAGDQRMPYPWNGSPISTFEPLY